LRGEAPFGLPPIYPQFMNSKASKAHYKSVQVRGSHNSLQLVFRHEKKRHWLSLGMEDTPFNRQEAQKKAREIERDIAFGEFDPTLAKYKVKSAINTVDAKPAEPKPKMTLINLWHDYMEYKSPNASPKTISSTYEPVLAHLSRCKTDGLVEPLKLRMELLQVTTQSQAKRTLMQISAACKWGMKHRLVPDNPFDGMYKELEATKPDPPMSFTVEERDLIITTFEQDTRPGINYRHYTPFVKFLFWSGCRPCEAIGLRWSSVSAKCDRVHFHESIVEVAGKQVRRKETKTGVDRWFSCTARLQEVLKSIRPETPDPEALVFISPKGSAIGESNFGDRAWKSILTKLNLYMKDEIKMTPYNCRDTFITLQAVEGVSSTTIARWVGNSSKVIEEKYLDKLKLEHLRPRDV
jgi:integrase